MPQSEQFIQSSFIHIQAYAEPWLTLLHMQKPSIFGILEYSEPFHNCIPMHIQNSVILTKKSKPFVMVEIQNPGILAILEYSEP